MKAVIHTENLSKSYGRSTGVKALDGLTLEVYEGETFGLLGPNGAGKTTAIRVLNCIIEPTGGTATVAGHDIRTQKTEVRRATGLLAESPGLYEKLSAFEFLEFVGALYDVPEDVLAKRIDELLRLFDLAGRRDDLLEGYSRGMKQRVLLAAALIHDPPVLFLDEPTSALDPRGALMVRDLIRGLEQRAGKTIFLSSHILPVVEELCDRIGILDRGRLVALGTAKEIVAKAGKENLEQAFIALTGGTQEKELLAWREKPRAA